MKALQTVLLATDIEGAHYLKQISEHLVAKQLAKEIKLRVYP